MKRIAIIITPEGESRVETHGFQGSECREASAFLERALGHRERETLTPEFYQSTQQNEQTEQRE